MIWKYVMFFGINLVATYFIFDAGFIRPLVYSVLILGVILLFDIYKKRL